jgi:outer membrane receptor for ferrienterochelin and colicin
MITWRPFLSVVLVAALVPGALAATPPPSEKVREMSLEELLEWRVTTASRTEEKAVDAPGTVYVVSSQDIRMRGYSTLMDVLRDLPGMETVEYYYSEQGSLVPVRGVVGNNKIVLLINGMRVNPPGGEELMIRSDVSIRSAEQIEIVYGPGSTLYGQDAISAVINIKTQQAGDKTEVQPLASYGKYNAREGFTSFSTRLRRDTDAPISVTGFASYKASDLSNFRTEFPDWWANYQRILPSLGRDPNADPVRGDLGYSAFGRLESKNASVQAWFRESQRSSAEGSGEGGSNPVLYFIQEAKWRDRQMVVEGQHALEFGKNVTLHSTLTFNRYEVDPVSRYVFPIPPSLFLRDFKYGLGTGAQLEEKLDYTVSDKTRLVFGLVAGNYDIIAKASVLDGADPHGDIGAQAGTLTYYTRANDPSSAVGIQRAENLQYQQYGAYAEGSHRFSNRLRAIAGLRVDGSTRYDGVPFSPRAALIYSAGEKLTLKYIFSRAYVAPAPYFGHNVYDNGVQISGGNSNLQPEKALSNEVNLTWQTKKLMLSASGFYNHQSNLLITNQSENPETVVPGTIFADLAGTQPRRLTRSVNLGNSNAPGLDLAMRYSSGHVSMWGSYSYVDFKRDLQGRKSGLENISHHNVRLGGTWSPMSKLSITPSLVFRSKPENLGPTYQSIGVSLDHPYEVNLNVLFAPTSKIDLFATARNVTNNHYALRGVAGPALQEPFAVVAGVRLGL